MKFRITWSTGKVEECEQSDCNTVEEFINSRFGSMWEPAKEAGVTVEEVKDVAVGFATSLELGAFEESDPVKDDADIDPENPDAGEADPTPAKKKRK